MDERTDHQTCSAATGLYEVLLPFDEALKAAAEEAMRVGRPVRIVSADDGSRIVVDSERHWWLA